MKTYKPYTKSRRNTVTINYRDFLTKSTPEKSLTSGFTRGYGRNNRGRITTRHKGGGNKKLFRDVDFSYNKKNIPAKIVSVEYDPNRSGFIGLAVYADGEKRYVLLPKSVKAGTPFIVAEDAPVTVANRLSLKNIPVGTFVYNVELKPLGGAKLARSAGNFVEVIAQDLGYTLLKLPSTEVRKVKDTCFATVGSVSNDEHHLVNLCKAGRNRWKGVRP
ncbi:MAG: 50S ribosomal protein L2, partial [Candidatus Paceibacterota bacterium]